MNKEELIERIEDFPCEASLVAEMIRINKNTLLGWVKELDEPQKVKIPDFVAEWIEYCKAHDFTLFGCIDPANDFEDLADETFKGDIRKCIRWCRRQYFRPRLARRLHSRKREAVSSEVKRYKLRI